MKDLNIVFAGFGGQGILFAGKVVAYAGLIEGRELSWLPSYGPEMRGGTANCSVVLSDKPVGSPVFAHPTELIALNEPSLAKFEAGVVPGGSVFVNSDVVTDKVSRTDLTAYYIPCSQIADEVGNPQKLGMWLDVNGVRQQTGNTKTMIFDVATIVSYCSTLMTLEPGDIITTGTPPGVGMGKKPNPVFLKPGDVITLGIDKLGEAKQTVVKFSPPKA